MELLDSFNRKIDYLRVSVTDRCNLRCIYCMPREAPRCASKADILGSKKLLLFVKIARKYGLKKVRLTGGEPLLRPDLAELIKGIKGVGIKDVSLTTNGILLSKHLQGLKNAGLDRVNLSLDTMRPERFTMLTRGGRIKNVLEAINMVEAAGLIPIKINMLPIRGINDDEIASFAALTLERPFHIRFIELMSVWEKAWGDYSLVKSKEAMTLIKDALGPLKWNGQAGSSRNYALKGARGVIGFISPESNHFCSSCNRLRITARGKLRPCLFSDFEVDLKKARSEEELEEMLLLAVKKKPAERNSACLPFNAMSQIGG